MNAQSKIEAPSLAKLREPFAPNHISKLPKPTKAQTDAVRADFKKGVRCKDCGSWHHPDVVHLDYVGHAALTDRLLDTDPEWSWEPVAFTDLGLPAFDQTGGLWIRLTVLGVTRLGYGHAAGKPNADPGAREKEVIGDALRNAAMRFGAALDLWHKGDLHADEDTAAAEPEAKQQRQQSDPNGPVEGGMPDAEWAKLAQLLKATETPAARLTKRYEVKNLRLLNQDQYADAIGKLTTTLAEKAKAETNRTAREPAGAIDIDEDEIPY